MKKCILLALVLTLMLFALPALADAPSAGETPAMMVRTFLSDCGMCTGQIDRVAYLVGHHHTFSGIDGIDYQILIEADYSANATENGYSRENASNFINRIMKSESGKRIAKIVFCLK